MMNPVEITLAELIHCQAHAKKLDLFSHKPAATLGGGNQTSRSRGRGLEFEEVRGYTPGDDIRHMDWRVTARTGKPHTKLYQEERERPVILIVDLNPSMFFGTKTAFKSVIAAKIAALIGWSAIQKGDRLGGLIFQNTQLSEFKPQAREKAILPFLHRLTEIKKPQNIVNDETSLHHALRQSRRLARPGSLFVVISDFLNFDNKARETMIALSQQHTLVTIQVNDPLEQFAPPPGIYTISDGERRLQFSSDTSSFSSMYEATFQQHYQTLRDTVKHYGILHIPCLTNDILIEKLHQGFHHG